MAPTSSRGGLARPAAASAGGSLAAAAVGAVNEEPWTSWSFALRFCVTSCSASVSDCHYSPRRQRKIDGGVGLVVLVSSHQSATFRWGGGHVCRKMARLATRQGCLDLFGLELRLEALRDFVLRFRLRLPIRVGGGGVVQGFWCLGFQGFDFQQGSRNLA